MSANDFRFGKDRSGDIALFQKLAPECGYEMHAVAALKQGRKIISSTRIRQLIGEGKLNEAARLLGRAVSVSGLWSKGHSAARVWVFPRPILLMRRIFFPRKACMSFKFCWGKKEYPAIANIGTRPSFEKQISKLHLEVHIFDFSKNIYGKHVEVEFLKKIRNEKKFTSPQELIQQIQKDEAFARTMLIR